MKFLYEKKICLKMNPKAKIVWAEFGKVASTEVLNTKLFSLEDAQISAGCRSSAASTRQKQKNMALVPLSLEVKNLLILNVFGIIYNKNFPIQLFVVKDYSGLPLDQDKPLFGVRQEDL